MQMRCYLNGVFFHGQGAVDAVQFEVEAAGVAHRLPLVVATPQRRCRRAAIGAAQSHPPRR